MSGHSRHRSKSLKRRPATPPPPHSRYRKCAMTKADEFRVKDEEDVKPKSREPVYKAPADFNLKDFIRRHWRARLVSKGQYMVDYTIEELMHLCHLVQKIVSAGDMMLQLRAPITIAGDIHGQYDDLMNVFRARGEPHKTNWLFLGDYVDRGNNSLECICLLFAYRAMYPQHFFLLRGNHECRSINRTYGFYDELQRRFGQDGKTKANKIYARFNRVFDYMPLTAVISDRILCMHGGISPVLTCREDLLEIERPLVEPEGLSEDLLWSDPAAETTEVDWFADNVTRSISYVFGKEAVKKCCQELSLDLIVRAHQVVQDGYEFFADRQVITIFSAAKYCNEFDNAAALLTINEDLVCRLTLMKPAKPSFSASDLRTAESKTNVQNE